MTPQSQFMVLADVTPGHERDLGALLVTMNSKPGVADPANAVVPFGQFQSTCILRGWQCWTIRRSATSRRTVSHARVCPSISRSSAAVTVPRARASRTWHGARTRACAESSCTATASTRTATCWLGCGRINVPLAANYINWVGRTVRQVKEESALRRALAAKVPRAPLASAAQAQQLRRELIDFVDAEVSAGRLGLTPPDPTPLRWQIAKLLHLVAIPLAGLILLPLLIVLSPLLILILRTRERKATPKSARLRTARRCWNCSVWKTTT